MDQPDESPDLWFAMDKLGHFVFCGFCTVAGFLVCLRRWEWRQWRYAAGTLLAVAIGALKEIGDGQQWWPGNVSLKDMGADLAGIIVALAALIIYEPYLTLQLGERDLLDDQRQRDAESKNNRNLT